MKKHLGKYSSKKSFAPKVETLEAEADITEMRNTLGVEVEMWGGN